MILTENGEERMCGGWCAASHKSLNTSLVLGFSLFVANTKLAGNIDLPQLTPQQKSMGEEDIQEKQFPHSMFTSLEKMQKDLSLHFSFSFYPPSASSAFLHHHRQCIMISWRVVMAMKSSLAVCTIVLRHLLW